MSVEFKIGRSKVSSSNLVKALVDSAQKDIESKLRKEIEKIKCPEHRKNLNNIRFKGYLSKNNFQLEAKCCCNKLEEKVYSVISKI